MKKKNLELYLHIPFCMQKCYYCDFLSAPSKPEVRQQYIEKLIKEIEQKAENFAEYEVSTIFFGGGTPSLLEGEQMESIMEKIAERFSVDKRVEITIECNPGTLTEKKISSYSKAGINRVSIGLQSAIDRELQILGRIHNYQQFLNTYDLVRKSGISNINVDIMFALPGQKYSDWEYTLQEVLRLRPEHISAYSLIIEEGTPFYQIYEEDECRRAEGNITRWLPDEETERAMYLRTGEMLLKKGYERYEISNYAKKGMECRHNIGYWRRENYLGLGLGSASLIENHRFSNTKDMSAYLGGDFEPKEQELLSRKQQLEEFMFLGLRMTEGVSRTRFREMFGVEIEAIYGEVLQRMKMKGLLKQQSGKILLMEEGISLSNYVMSEFLLEN